MLTTAKDRDSALNGLVEKWAGEYNPEKPGAIVLTASRNVDVNELNTRARAAMVEKGHLSGIRAEVKSAHGSLEFQAGDRIFFSAISKDRHHDWGFSHHVLQVQLQTLRCHLYFLD
jgi:hypothetical protein